MTSSSSFASFAHYTPPPGESLRTSSNRPIKPWFPTRASSAHETITSYQSGGIPTFGTSVGPDVVEEQQNQWETRYGMRVDILAAAAYILGPISALFLLILETHNDYVRFHAYQSALLTTPLVIIRIFLSLARVPSWIQTMTTIFLVVCQGYMTFRTYLDASRCTYTNRLPYYLLPVIGPISERWLVDEQ